MAKEIDYVGADVNLELGAPRRYPAVTGRPSPAWVSQIGGRWRTIYRPGGSAETLAWGRPTSVDGRPA
jgi:hypothetical protein